MVLAALPWQAGHLLGAEPREQQDLESCLKTVRLNFLLQDCAEAQAMQLAINALQQIRGGSVGTGGSVGGAIVVAGAGASVVGAAVGGAVVGAAVGGAVVAGASVGGRVVVLSAREHTQI